MNLCDANRIQELVTAIESGADAIERIDQVLMDFPQDARLHFMRGSSLASAGRLIEAYDALKRAVELDPDFPIARFQLGLFELTSGEADKALDTWGRLDRLPDGHYLRKFIDGLRCLVRDDFRGAIDHLSEGIALNHEIPPLNNDMRMLISQCEPLLRVQQNGAGEPASETSLILQQFADRNKLH